MYFDDIVTGLRHIFGCIYSRLGLYAEGTASVLLFEVSFMFVPHKMRWILYLVGLFTIVIEMLGLAHF